MSMDPVELGRQVVDAALAQKVDNVEVRIQDIRQREVETRNCRTNALENRRDRGVAVRVLWRGAWGVAATTDVSLAGAGGAVTQAVEMAQALRATQAREVRLAPEPGHGEVEWSSPCRQDPLAVPVFEVAELLNQWSAGLLAASNVDDVHARVAMQREESVTVTSSGTTAIQWRTQIHPLLHVGAVPRSAGQPATARSLGPPTQRGWEYVEGEGWDWDAEWARLPEELAQTVCAPDVEPGVYDLVVAPSNLWLTLHETVGHATELDRMLGLEQGYAGTSFVQLDDVGSLEYGSPLMNVVADRTQSHGLATIGCDAEGVLAQRWALVEDGRLVSIQSDRASAAAAGQTRSTGCSFAESPLRTPLARMANVSLQPAATGPSTDELIASVDRGLLLVGSGSWSIDMNREDFQFGAQRWYRIKDGHIVGQVRHGAYRGRTQPFWKSLSAVGGPETFEVYGADLCGKGQPPQASGTSHGAPVTLFSGVDVFNTRGAQ